MTIEANAMFGWPMAGMANRLRRHPAEVQQLNAYKIALDQISQSRTQVLDVPLAVLQGATIISRQSGLLVNDALIVAMMRVNGLTNITANSDIDRRLPRKSPRLDMGLLLQ